MKKLDAKSLIIGLIIGSIGITTVFAAGGIKSAAFSNAKVTLNGVEISLSNSLVSIVKDDEEDAKLYMPVRELLENLGYTVNWDGAEASVNLISNEKVSFYARVLQHFDTFILVEGIPENDINHKGQFYVSLKNPDDENAVSDVSGKGIPLSDLPEDCLVLITYNGESLSSYPAQIRGAYTIRMVE